MSKNIDKEVLSFYKKLPFNIYDNIDKACENIKKFNLKKTYPFLVDPIIESSTIIDIGCGGGWLVNSIAHNYKKKILGLDFNFIAIDFAKKVSQKLENNIEYEVDNIFEYTPKSKFDLILSLGVLHHTRDCLKALDKICKFGEKKSKIFIGLYHKQGRKPFLEFVDSLKNLSEKEKFDEYKKIHKLDNDLHQKSWFRDQVLHPYESLHDLDEVLSIFKKNNYKFIGTSINVFNTNDSMDEILKKEKNLYQYGKDKIEKKIYYPGFFIVGGQKNEL